MSLATRLTVAMVTLAFLTASAVAILTYRNVETAVLPRALDRLDLELELLATRLDAATMTIRADVSGFRAAIGLNRMMQASQSPDKMADGVSLERWRALMAARFGAELEAKPAYTQFRVIGMADGGREIIRVDRSGPGGAIRVVPEAELQAKGDRDYFLQSAGLPNGEIYVSPVELNQERGQIETPYEPVLRAASPFFDSEGRVFGIVVINLDLRPAFQLIRSFDNEGPGSVYVVNERGDYLLHPDTRREFGFEFGKPTRIQDDFPELMLGGAVRDLKGRIIADRNGDRFGAAITTVQLAQGRPVSVVEIVPYANLLASTRVIRDASLIAGTIAVLCAIGFAIPLARSLTRPLVQMTQAVQAFGGGRPLAVPTGAGGEIGVLARAFSQMADDARDKTLALTREIEERRRIFETSVDLILVVDRHGEILRASPSCRTILGYQPEEMIGRNTVGFVDPDDIEATRGEMHMARHGQVIHNFDCRYIHKNGHPVTLSWSGVWSEPEQRHFLIGRDMTEYNKLEQHARQAQKMDAIGQLTGGIAHDFNNILTVIIGTSEIVYDALADQPKLAELVKMIDAAAERGSGLTRQLLAFARRQPLQPRVININDLILETAQLLRGTIGENVEIASILEGNLMPALVDPNQLSTALLNLAINARDAMPQGGKLIIETDNVLLDEAYAADNAEVTPGPYTMIAVTDTGSGIPAAIRDKVFEPFFTTKGVGQGTGLGLSMVYGFVKQSNGHVKIYSEDGHGTAIKIYLPQARAQDGGAIGHAAAGPMEGGHETILVVEDDDLLRRNVVVQLQNLGYATLRAANAEEALALIDRGERVDLLFTDVVMPGTMNGRQLAVEVVKRRPTVRVLFTSGYTENSIVHQGRLDRGVYLLEKPYRKPDLARMVRVALSGGAAPARESRQPGNRHVEHSGDR